MRLPDHVFSIVRALHEKHRALALGNDDDRRALQQKVVETVVARHPAEGWGWKKAGPTNPPSKDAIANNKLLAPSLICWDCFNGSTREPVQGDSLTIDGQVFISVAGVDHLVGGVRPAVVEDPRGREEPAVVRSAALPSRQEFFEVLTWLDTLYRDQLDRPGGVDLEGIAAHVFDLYLSARMAGASAIEGKRKIVKQINDILGRRDIHV